MKHLKNRLMVCFVLVSAIMMLGIVPAHATCHTEWLKVIGASTITNTDSTKTVGYGTKGNLYIYPQLTPQYCDWVNSLYAGTALGSYYEAGWFWSRYPASQPAGFTCYYKYTERDGICEQRVQPASLVPGTRVTFEIHNDIGTDTWRTYISSVLVDTWSNTGITSAHAAVGAERYNYIDINKGSFEHVKYYKKTASSYAWTYWTGAKMHKDNDPYYNFYSNKVNSSTHWVYMDDHQSN